MAAGKKTGGRQKGSQNIASVRKAEEIASSGLTPLDYMLSLLRNEEQPLSIRFEAAKAAAPYVHPKLNATTHSGPDGLPIQSVHTIEYAIVDPQHPTG